MRWRSWHLNAAATATPRSYGLRPPVWHRSWDTRGPPVFGPKHHSTRRHRHEQQRLDYYQYIDEGPKPSITVIEDLDEPAGFGAFWEGSGRISTKAGLPWGGNERQCARYPGLCRGFPDDRRFFRSSHVGHLVGSTPKSQSTAWIWRRWISCTRINTALW